ncbi:MAG: type II toxin-antitoxin system VapC family toxin [Chloroflexi bacterium]|nr:type II toxin-antitoxin system VapC family toxin [Chloroflexota bacterium]
MIIDTSALVAVLLGEPEAPAMARAMAAAPACRISAATYLELAIVVDGRRDATPSGAIDALLRRGRIEVVPFTEGQARIAREAYQRFGRGSGHPARLNMGDCFAYALARDLGEPLLFKGHDFALTDIELVTEPVKSRRLSEVVAAYSAQTAAGRG